MSSSDKLIILLFGQEFAPAVIFFTNINFKGCFYFYNSSFGKFIGSCNKQTVETKISALGAIANVALNLLLIPRIGYIGASVTSIATEITVLLMNSSQNSPNHHSTSQKYKPHIRNL